MSVATINFLVTNILQNIFFCAQRKKETQVWNKMGNHRNIFGSKKEAFSEQFLKEPFLFICVKNI